MSERPPGNWELALVIRRERLALIQRVLEIQREIMMLEGREPSAEEVAKAIEGG